MKDGIILPDSVRGKPFGFTTNKFARYSYLWKIDDAIYISLIESKKKGNFKALVEKILAAGLTVKVATPLPQMERIVKKAGYRYAVEHGEMGAVDIWVLEPQKVS